MHKLFIFKSLKLSPSLDSFLATSALYATDTKDALDSDGRLDVPDTCTADKCLCVLEMWTVKYDLGLKDFYS